MKNLVELQAHGDGVDLEAWLAKGGENLTRKKGDYTIPFRVMFVFERPADGQPWRLVHAHFTVPPA